jgi:hypothetical protein
VLPRRLAGAPLAFGDFRVTVSIAFSNRSHASGTVSMSSDFGFLGVLAMPNPILGATAPDTEIYTRIGKVAAEWAWIEILLAEMLAHSCHADPGAMYVITQNVSAATITDWLRTLTQIQIKDAPSATVILNLLNEIDDARGERNTIVHGTWFAADEPGFAWLQTFKWERQEVARSELWSTGDLDAVIDNLTTIQLMLSNLGITMGFLKLQPS